jgi:hypothetical protein
LRRDRHRLGELFKRLPPLRKTAKESDVKKSLFMSKIGWRANVNPRASECIPRASRQCEEPKQKGHMMSQSRLNLN